MELNANINLSIHNRFDIVSRDIRTGEIQKAQAENIVLDRIYSRLCNFQSHFIFLKLHNHFSQLFF